MYRRIIRKIFTFPTHYTVTTNASGEATIFLTDSGLVGGIALFTTILAIHTTPTFVGVNPYDCTFAEVKSLSPDFKTLVVRALSGTRTTVLLGGNINSLAFSNGASVYVTIHGK